MTQRKTEREVVTEEDVPTKSVAEENNKAAAGAVWFILGVILVFLGFRFFFKVFGANPSNGFVDFVYSVSGFFTAPFDSIFNVRQTSGEVINAVFEPSILVAMVVYSLLAWGVVKLLEIVSSKS